MLQYETVRRGEETAIALSCKASYKDGKSERRNRRRERGETDDIQGKLYGSGEHRGRRIAQRQLTGDAADGVNRQKRYCKDEKDGNPIKRECPFGGRQTVEPGLS